MKDLTTGNVSKVIFNFAIPMLLGNVFQQLYNIVDSIIIGNYLGKEALGAVGASFPLIFVLISLVIGFASGITIIISQYFGAKQMNNVKKAIDTMYIVLFFSSIAISIIGITFSDEIFRLIKLPEEIIPQAKLYFNIYAGGIIFLFGFNGISAVLRGLGDSKTPLYFMIFATIINICLDLLFVVVLNWGIEGVAIATVIAQAGAFIFAILYLNKYHSFIKINFRKLDFDKYIFKKSIYIGLPSGMQQMFVAIGMMALYRIVNDFGTDVIAAYSVVGRIDMFAMLPAMNFAAALSAFVGQNLGANKPERVKNGLIATLIMASVISIATTVIALLFGRELMGMFTKDTEVIKIGVSYLTIVSSFYIIFSSMFAVTSVFRGAGDTIVPMFITLLALWFIRVPVSYFLSLEIGEIGIWWGIPIAWTFGLCCSISYYFTGRWKRKVIVKY
ncbi:MAG: MATE family efflux transporter [Bacteroidales bacterium]|nr:MATE family efflux transporter [Bacteroidales bacterium]